MCRNSSNMVVPTLPVIGVAPPFELFQIMNWIAITLGYVLLTAAVVSTLVLSFKPLLIPILYCIKPSRRTPKQRGLDNCHRCMNSVFLFAGSRLCVYTFPALFKTHKTHSGDEEFIVFLDREAGGSLVLIAAFYSIIFSIFCSCTMIFLRYFPVKESTECLEKDSHGQSLFCYRSNSSLPVDCANFSVTELQGIEFECYAIAIPGGLGIAAAAALGLAKVAIEGVTIYVKVTKWFIMVTKNPPQKLQEVCCCNCGKRQHVISIYTLISCLLLSTAALVTLACGIYFIVDYVKRDQDPLLIMYYAAYMLLPLLIFFPLAHVILYLSKHCDKGEYYYASFAADQRPPNWDVESQPSVTSGEHDEDFGRERGNITNCEGLDRAKGEDREHLGREVAEAIPIVRLKEHGSLAPPAGLAADHMAQPV